MDEELDDLEKMISELDADYVPTEFITAACLICHQNEIVLTKEEFEDLLCDEEALDEMGVEEIGVLINVPMVKETIIRITSQILKCMEDK